MNLLSHQEIYELTHRKKKTAQRAALNQMGIEYKVRPDGTLAVLDEHVKMIMGAKIEGNQRKRSEPNWEALRA